MMGPLLVGVAYLVYYLCESQAIFINGQLFRKHSSSTHSVLNSAVTEQFCCGSTGACGIACLTSSYQCQTFFYNDQSGICALSSDMIHMKTSGVELFDSTGFHLYTSGGVIGCERTDYVLNPRTQTCSGFHPHSSRNWDAAKAHCEDILENLQTLPTLEDAEWLFYQIQQRPDDRPYWIGGLQENGVWVWEGCYSGSLDYNFWNNGPPVVGNCIIMFRQGMRFRAIGCRTWDGIGGICETGSIVVNTDS